MRTARLLVRIASLLLPAGEREEWREEWLAELEVLERRGDGAAAGLSFALGALPAAVGELAWGWSGTGAGMDVRTGLRGLRQNPTFAAVTVGTLALGIGANAAVFAVVNGVLFRPAPQVADPDQVVQIGRSYRSAPSYDNWSWPFFELLSRESGSVLEHVAGYQRYAAILGSGVVARQVAIELVTGEYFRTLGVRPALGRLLGPEDDRPGAPPVAVLSYAAWRGRYGGDPGVLGTVVRVNGSAHEVVGVAPEDFLGVEKVGTPATLWVPTARWSALRGDPEATPFEDWGWSWLALVGRLRAGVGPGEVRERIGTLAARHEPAVPYYFQNLVPVVARGVGLDPDGRREARTISALLLGVGLVVLLITCANVANLLLVRASTREQEMGVRLALGAGRGRLVRQLLVESALLGCLGFLAAAPLAWAAEWLHPLLFPGEPGLDLAPDAAVFAFAAAAGAAAVGLFGLAPAVSAARRSSLAGAFRKARSAGGRSRVASALVVVQLALCLGLLAGAASLAASLWNARTAEPGFETARLLAVDVHYGHLEGGPEDEDEGAALLERVRDRLAAAPGVRAVTWASAVPVADFQSSGSVRAGAAPTPEDRGVTADRIVVGPAYFTATGIRLVRGREPSVDDVVAGEAVAVVSRSLVPLLWPDGTDPLGATVGGLVSARVVGVAEEVRHRGVGVPPRPTLYVTRAGGPVAPAHASFLARTAGPAPGAASALGDRVADVDPGLAVTRVTDLRSVLARSLGETRTTGWLVAILAAVALLLATVGLFGLLAFSVERRRRELGIRSALGARPGHLVWTVVRHGLVLAGVGVLLGSGVAWGVSAGLRSLLYGVAPGDPRVLAATAGVLLFTTVLAAWVPARRAVRADPVEALAGE